MVPSGKATTTDPQSQVTDIWGMDGTIYSRFELTLPRGTKLSRDRHGALICDSPRIKFMLRASYDGFATVLPNGFLEAYVAQDFWKTHVLRMEFELVAEIKRWSLLTRRGWQYYYWIDSFADEIERFASSSEFFRRIRWDSIWAFMRADGRLSGRRGAKPSPSRESH